VRGLGDRVDEALVAVVRAKYTTCAAPGAAAPMTSMSKFTSTSAPVGSEPGALAAPSTLTAVIEGTAMFRPPK